jgi:hypothetical protein
VPEENIGQNPKIVQLGTQELSEHGEEVKIKAVFTQAEPTRWLQEE